jgi:hypothetical protein
MRRSTPLLLVGLLWAAAACSRSPVAAPADAARDATSGDVEATLAADGVTLVNGTNRGIAYAVWNPKWLGLMAVCDDPGPSCVRLAPGQSVVVPESQFSGWNPSPGVELQPEARALEVRWWHVLPDGAGGYAASEVRVIPLVP